MPHQETEELRSISALLIELQDNLTEERTSIDAILEAFHERGFGFFLLIFAFPMGIPFPVPPGVNILLASPLIFLTLQQFAGRHTIWLPERMRKQTFATRHLKKAIDKAIPWAEKLQLIVCPRLGFVTHGIFSNIIGFLGFLMALSVFIPLPLTNTIPAFAIAVMAIGVIMRDGLAVIAGALIGTAWVVLIFSVIWFLGVEGLDLFKELIKDMI